MALRDLAQDASTRTGKQLCVLQPDGGRTPASFDDNGEIRVARRLMELGLLVAGDGSDYVPTAAGRVALGLDMARPAKRVRAALRRSLTWLGMDPDAWQVLVGRQLPVIKLDEAAFRRFA